MAYHTDLRRALIKWLGKDKVILKPGWDKKQRGIAWRKDGLPVALLTHHTAGAATQNNKDGAAGNRHGDNDGIINFVQNHFEVPAANLTLDRDGCVVLHSAYPVWHAGKGSFKGDKIYEPHGIPDDMGNDYMLGVEVVSRGLQKDWTPSQKKAYGALANACAEASGWKGFYRRLPNHKTWAPNRKVDSRYKLITLRKWAVLAKRRGPKSA